MGSFVENYEYLLSRSLNYGGQDIPHGVSPNEYFRDVRAARRFYAACHRGFEKAQRLALQTIRTNRDDGGISGSEKTTRELIIRKAVDGIAYMMAMTETHVMRRLCIHDSIPSLNLSVASDAIVASERLNAESRQTFALVCDLTTFMHIGDLFRIDLRSGQPKIEIIELKSGKINALLLEQLSEYPLGSAGIDAVDADSRIHPDHKAQAKRMLRQKTRMAQAQSVLLHDVGIDPGYQLPIRLSKDAYVLDTYDHFLNDLCDEAVENGYSGGTVQHCVHIAVTYSQRPSMSRETVRNLMHCVVNQHELRSSSSLKKLRSEHDGIIPPQPEVYGR